MVILHKMSQVSQENWSTATRPTRCGEPFVGDNPNSSKDYGGTTSYLAFHFYIVQIPWSAKKLGDKIKHGSTPPYPTTLVCTFQFLKDAKF
jgi:hypothetical protein